MMGCYALNRSDLGQRPVEGSCEQINEISCSVKYLEILGSLSNWLLLKNSAL
jgi:hypothetical protein